MIKEDYLIEGRNKETVVLRVASYRPYSAELTSEQLELLADIAERYGSGRAHVTARQTIEIPDIPKAFVDEVVSLLETQGLRVGSTGRQLRNVIACSRWCLYNVMPLSELACELNKKYMNMELPGKTIISLSGCDFSCVRSRTSDIGVIARADIGLTEKQCKHCRLCIKEPLGCQVDAITLTEDGVSIDRSKCVRCGFCWNVCRPGSIEAQKTYFDVFIGGRGGLRPQEAVYLLSVQGEEDLKRALDRIIQTYIEQAKEGERIADLINSKGVEVFNGRA
jgi:dissimilatory sulfite reductase (desulfoviridin) alpha/beta subunit